MPLSSYDRDMSVSAPIPEPSVEITPRAVAEMELICAGRTEVIQLSVAGMACCGPTYRLRLTKPDGEGSRIGKDFGSVRLVVDPSELAQCAGVTIDYVEDGGASGFLVAGASGSCGCGGRG
jgi:iron-sulfur cluster assembly accessory protein